MKLLKLMSALTLLFFLNSVCAFSQQNDCLLTTRENNAPWFEFLLYTETGIRAKQLPLQFNRNIVSVNRISSFTVLKKSSGATKAIPVTRFTYNPSWALSSIDHFDSIGNIYMRDILQLNQFHHPVKWSRYLKSFLCFSDTIVYNANHKVSTIRRTFPDSLSFRANIRYAMDSILWQISLGEKNMHFYKISINGQKDIIRMGHYYAESRYEMERFYLHRETGINMFQFEISADQMQEWQRFEVYDKNNRLIAVSESSEGKLRHKERYQYTSKGLLKRVVKYDENNKVYQTLDYRYQYD